MTTLIYNDKWKGVGLNTLHGVYVFCSTMNAHKVIRKFREWQAKRQQNTVIVSRHKARFPGPPMSERGAASIGIEKKKKMKDWAYMLRLRDKIK